MFKRFIAASRTELITLAGAIVTIIVALWKTFSEPIANCSGNFKCLANYLLDNLTFFNVTVFLVASICAIAILILNFQRLIESMRKERDEPVGFFFDEVSAPGKAAVEHSLVEVRRMENGGLEYRGVGRPTKSSSLEFCWRARDTWLHKKNQTNRLVFRTYPQDIFFFSNTLQSFPPEIIDDVKNIGVIEYQQSKGFMRGLNFDYTDRGDYLTIKTIRLSPASELISKKAPQIFDEFFNNPKELKRQRRNYMPHQGGRGTLFTTRG